VQAIFLGAGASAAAGYPLAGGFLPALEAAVRAEPGCANLQDAWTVWQDYRDRAWGPVKVFLESANPEVVFSFLDLYSAAKEADFRARMASAKSGEKRPRRRESRQLADALRAREHLLVCLDWFFAFRHHDDGMPGNRSRRDYLRALLGTLSAGDVVITLNWDTTVERTLAELGQWNPTTGYGFPKPLAVGLIGSRHASDFDPRCEARLLDSPVRVLKLHGSFGWYHGSSGLYFDHTSFLDPFGFAQGRKPIELTDPNHKEPGTGPPENRVLLYPSFLKQVIAPEMLRVWEEADRALHEAARVRVIGYSLPSSDGAVRAILNPLRCRADHGEALVWISNPNAEARQRWRELLGQRVTVDDNRLGSESAS
jgi:hypothetical protein